MDAFVRSDGLSASAAFFRPSIDIRRLFKIPHPSSSVTAELAAIDVAHKYVQEGLPASMVVILTDPRGALSRLISEEMDSLILSIIMESINNILSRGVCLAAQWAPSHWVLRAMKMRIALLRHATMMAVTVREFYVRWTTFVLLYADTS